MAYIDTSLLVAYYCPEALSSKAERYIRRSADAPTISPLVEVEFRSALAIKVRMGELDAMSAHRVLALFQAHRTDGGYRIIPVTDHEFTVASEWLGAFSLPLRTLDALHLAAASAHGLTVLTADKGLARSAKQLRLPCRLVR